jgi:phosphate transport system substrate-binding protein
MIAFLAVVTIRVFGSSFGGLVERWEERFTAVHPGVRFENRLPTSDAAIPALVTGVADLAPDGGEPTLTEDLSFYEVHGYPPTAIAVASGAFDADGKSNGLVVFVHRDNPISDLTIEQLDGIFGAERTAGMHGFRWTRGGARSDIRTWGQLGLGGDWAEKPIHTYGHAPSGTARFFQLAVLGNSDKWNPNFREFVETGSKMMTDDSVGLRHMLRDELAHDRAGIAWTVLPQAKGIAGIKPIAINSVFPTRETFQNRTYPLTRSIYIFLDRKPGTPVDPKLKAFLSYILSHEGQDVVARDGGYLPLPQAVAREQLEKLE